MAGKHPVFKYRVAEILLATVFIAVAGAFLLLSRQTASFPEAREFDGWIALLGPADRASTGRVMLRLAAIDAGAPGNRPSVRISITTCGLKDQELLLLLGDDARLEDAVDIFGLLDDTPEELSNFLVIEATGGAASSLSEVDAYKIPVEGSGECFEGVQPMYVALAIDGRLRAPVQGTDSVLGLEASRELQSWPLIGGAPGLSPHSKGVFLTSHIDGEWLQPVTTFVLNVGKPTIGTFVEAARPELASTDDLAWESFSPIRPEAVVVDTRQVSSQQNIIAGLGILLGVVGSLLASLAHEALRRSGTSAQGSQQAIDPPAAEVTAPVARAGQKSRVVVLTAGFLIGILLGRRHTR